MMKHLILIGMLVACGGSDLGTRAVTADEARPLCAQNCEREQTCASTAQTLAACTQSCVDESAGWLRGDALQSIVECQGAATCEIAEDRCMLEVAPLAAHLEWQHACEAVMSTCGDLELCEVEGAIAPEGFGMVMRLLAPELVPRFVACLDESSCEARTACVVTTFDRLVSH